MALFISPKDGSMAKTVLHTDDSGVRAVLVFTDRHGNPAAPAFPPAWSLSNDSLMSLTVSDDGLTATLVPTGGVGDLTVDVVAEGDPTPGVNTLHASGDIQILAAEAAFVELQFNPLT